jgi:hypothetical protein
MLASISLTEFLERPAANVKNDVLRLIGETVHRLTMKDSLETHHHLLIQRVLR